MSAGFSARPLDDLPCPGCHRTPQDGQPACHTRPTVNHGLRQVFIPDAIHDDTVAGGFRGGIEEKIAFLKQALGKVVISQHIVSTTLLELHSDTADARSVCQCPMVVNLGNGNTQVFFEGLWYHDVLVRTPAGWRISERVERNYYVHNLPEGFRFQD